MVGLVAEVAQTFIATGFLPTFALIQPLEGSLESGDQLVGNAANVTGPARNVVKEDQGRDRCAGPSVDCTIQVVTANTQCLTGSFQ